MDERQQETVKTDLERFVALYKSFGIECKVVTHDMVREIMLAEGGYYNSDYTLSDKFDGYFDFYTKITFSLDGTFIKQGFWE